MHPVPNSGRVSLVTATGWNDSELAFPTFEIGIRNSVKDETRQAWVPRLCLDLTFPMLLLRNEIRSIALNKPAYNMCVFQHTTNSGPRKDQSTVVYHSSVEPTVPFRHTCF
jgi:hypothetical protein